MSNGCDVQGHSRPCSCRTGLICKVTRGRIHVERVRYGRSLADAFDIKPFHLQGHSRTFENQTKRYSKCPEFIRLRQSERSTPIGNSLIQQRVPPASLLRVSASPRETSQRGV